MSNKIYLPQKNMEVFDCIKWLFWSWFICREDKNYYFFSRLVD